MTTTLRISTGHTPDGAPQLIAVGEIDLSNAAEFARALADNIGPDRRLLVDLTQVDYLDSAALAALFTHANHIDIHISPLNQTLLAYSGLIELTNVNVIPTPPAEHDRSPNPT
jgi:anti-sigma B factor antagonist